jgi:hypothetical protein
VHVPFADAPSATVQALQVPVQAALQHTPSELNPLAQFDPLLSVCPFAFRQAPLGEQVSVPVHCGASGVPVPAAPSSVAHVPGVLPAGLPSHF